MFRQDPGLCPICDAPHCGCTPGGADSVVILGQRDALIAAQLAVEPSVQSHEPAAELQRPSEDGVDGVMGDGPEPFTTASYSRTRHAPKRPKR